MLIVLEILISDSASDHWLEHKHLQFPFELDVASISSCSCTDLFARVSNNITFIVSSNIRVSGKSTYYKKTHQITYLLDILYQKL